MCKVEVLDLALRVPYGVTSDREGRGALRGDPPCSQPVGRTTGIHGLVRRPNSPDPGSGWSFAHQPREAPSQDRPL